MRRYLIILILSTLLSPVSMAQNPADTELMRLSDEILGNLQKYYPVVATSKGIHDYDNMLTDYSSRAVKAEIAALKKLRSRLEKIKPEVLSAESRIDRKLLTSNVETALQDLDRIKWYQKNPKMYTDDVIDGIFMLMVSSYAPLSERAEDVMARWKLVPGFLAQAKLNLKKPAPIFIRLALENTTTGGEFFKAAAETIKNELPGRESEINAAVLGAIAALEDFGRFLKKVPAGSPGSFAIGKTEYDFKLKNEYYIDYDADSLLKIGEALFHQADSMYRDYERWLESNPTDQDSVYILGCINRDELFNYYGWEIDQTIRYLKKKDLMTVPDDIGKCIVMQTPPFLRNVISGIAYMPPGTFNSDQTGHFFVRPIPDSLDEGQRAARYRYILRRGFRGSIVHEGYPGHHFQNMMASRLENPIRKWQENLCSEEGWALYCEEMMYNSGFYGPDKRPYLNMLGGIAFRAARIIVDTRLQTGKFTPDEAVQWMATALDEDTAFSRTEVNWYTLEPTVPMSYLIGKIELLKLREAMKARDGDKFTLKDFHDRFLSEGIVPPRILWEIWNLK